jgi:pyranose oxidase
MNVDVLIIGSGPVGATFARVLSEAAPAASILMVDLGPRLSRRAGQHVKNMAAAVREAAQIASQGPYRQAYPLVSVAERAAAARAGSLDARMLARPGTHLVTSTPQALRHNQMPAASMSSNLGGMGAHWTCACPRPGDAERIPFIPEAEYERVFSRAEALLQVTQHAFPETPESRAILRVLGETFNGSLSPDRQVQPMPLACMVDDRGSRYWTGSDVILGPLADPRYRGGFEIRTDTICRRLLNSRGRISGAVLEHLPTQTSETIHARVVIVAADALRTPQLLWASRIRPPALGRCLNEHPFIFTFVELRDDLVDPNSAPPYDPSTRSEPTIGVFWVPFDAPGHPFHGQVMHMDVSPLQIETRGHPKHVVGLGWGPLKEVRADDRITFSTRALDYLGMPSIRILFQHTARDLVNIEAAKRAQTRATAAFGRVLQTGEQTLMPAGSSLHYAGTVRMGERDDGASVCDPHGRVWGFDNLFVGGNGVIPVATASNPTLTSVAMAVRACDAIVDWL